jgi:hypothetical protein
MSDAILGGRLALTWRSLHAGPRAYTRQEYSPMRRTTRVHVPTCVLYYPRRCCWTAARRTGICRPALTSTTGLAMCRSILAWRGSLAPVRGMDAWPRCWVGVARPGPQDPRPETAWLESPHEGKRVAQCRTSPIAAARIQQANCSRERRGRQSICVTLRGLFS